MPSPECVEHRGYHRWHDSKQHERRNKQIIIGDTLRMQRGDFWYISVRERTEGLRA